MSLHPSAVLPRGVQTPLIFGHILQRSPPLETTPAAATGTVPGGRSGTGEETAEGTRDEGQRKWTWGVSHVNPVRKRTEIRRRSPIRPLESSFVGEEEKSRPPRRSVRWGCLDIAWPETHMFPEQSRVQVSPCALKAGRHFPDRLDGCHLRQQGVSKNGSITRIRRDLSGELSPKRDTPEPTLHQVGEFLRDRT